MKPFPLLFSCILLATGSKAATVTLQDVVIWDPNTFDLAGLVSGTFLGNPVTFSTTAPFDTTSINPAITANNYLLVYQNQFTSPNAYSLNFTVPITNPIFNINGLYNTISFDGSPEIQKISGLPGFQVIGSTVSGDPLSPNPNATNLNGAFRLLGTFNSISWSSTGIPDRIQLQVGLSDAFPLPVDPVSVIPEPASSTALLALLASALMVRRRQAA